MSKMPESGISNSSKETENINKETEVKKYSIYARVPEKIRLIIDGFKDKGKSLSYIISSAIEIYEIFNAIPNEISQFVLDHAKEYGGQKELVIEALYLLLAQKQRDKASDENLWLHAKEEIDMMLIQKKKFKVVLDILDESHERFEEFANNFISPDVILWYTGKPLKDLSLEALILAIKKLFIAFNFFYMIDINKETDEKFFITFNHRLNKEYSKFWLKYLKHMLNSDKFSFMCTIDGEAYETTLSITINLIS